MDRMLPGVSEIVDGGVGSVASVLVGSGICDKKVELATEVSVPLLAARIPAIGYRM